MVIALMVLAIFLVSCAVEEVEVDEAEAALDAIEAVAVPEDSEDSALAGEATTAEKKICKLDSACKSEFYDCYKQDCSAIRNELRKVQQLMKGKRVATNLWFSYKQLKSEFSVCYNVCYDKALPAQGLNTTGAGDAFGSSLVSGLITYKGDVKKALHLAIVRSNYVVRKVGAQEGLLSKKELTKFKI